MDTFTQSYLRASTLEAVTVEVGDPPGQRKAQHLQLLPADHMTRQMFLGARWMIGTIVNL